MPLEGYAMDVRVAGDFAYLADGTALQVLDVSRPEAPVTVARADVPGFATCLALSGKFAYVGDTFCPADGPPVFSSAPGDDFAEEGGGTFGLQVFDISRPNQPVKVNRRSLTGHNHVSALCVSSNRAYWVESGIKLVDVSDPVRPHFLPSPPETHDRFWGACLVSSFLYLASEWEDGGFRIYDVRGPDA
jgi:hypothetical protein